MRKQKGLNLLFWIYGIGFLVGWLFYNSCESPLERGFVLLGGILLTVTSLVTTIPFICSLSTSNSNSKKPKKFDYRALQLLKGTVEYEEGMKEYQKRDNPDYKVITLKGGSIRFAPIDYNPRYEKKYPELEKLKKQAKAKELIETIDIKEYKKKAKAKTIEDIAYNNLRNYIIACSKNGLFTRDNILILKKEIDYILGDNIHKYKDFSFENDMHEIYTKIKSSKFGCEEWEYLLEFCSTYIDINANIDTTDSQEEIS